MESFSFFLFFFFFFFLPGGWRGRWGRGDRVLNLPLLQIGTTVKI